MVERAVDIQCWLNLDYAALLYLCAQLKAADAWAVDAWDAAAWYCKANNLQVTDVYTLLDQAWHDATGEFLLP